VDRRRLGTTPDEEVVGLDIPVHKVAAVDGLETPEELLCETKHGLERKPAATLIEEVLEARAQQIHDHGVVVALDAAPPHDGHALSPDERAVDAALVEELRMPRLDRLELDGHLLAGRVTAREDLPKAPGPDLRT